MRPEPDSKGHVQQRDKQESGTSGTEGPTPRKGTTVPRTVGGQRPGSWGQDGALRRPGWHGGDSRCRRLPPAQAYLASWHLHRLPLARLKDISNLRHF